MSRGFACIGLSAPKTDLNVGAAMRAAGCYGAAFVATTGTRFKKACTDTHNYHRHAPLFRVPDLRSITPLDCIPIAIELLPEATPLPEFVHPQRAFYIFGPEDGTLERKTIEWCKEVVYVPTTHCMNLAATVNVVLYDRLVKTQR